VILAVVGPACQLPPSPRPADLALADSAASVDARTDSAKEGGCITLPEAGPGDLAPIDLAPIDLVQDQRLDAPIDLGGVDAGDLGPSPCPPCMALVKGTFCMDTYEASRPDATSSSPGTLSTVATCKAGVIPWHFFGLTKAEAQGACAAAGKRLCTPTEWEQACHGPQLTVYSYGSTYDPTTCNGIDTYCFCGAGQACDGVLPCPYPHCFNLPPPGSTTPPYCGSWFHVMPTGSFPGCVDAWGVYDLNGNVWELVDTSDGLDHFRGGAYNCGDSETLHRCDYDATWGPSAQGFRCCADSLVQG